MARQTQQHKLTGYNPFEDIVVHGNYVWNFNTLQWERMTQPTINAGDITIDPGGLATEAGLGTDGASPPAHSGTGIRGWLRSIYDRLVASALESLGLVASTQTFTYTVDGDIETIVTVYPSLGKQKTATFAYVDGNIDSITTAIANWP